MYCSSFASRRHQPVATAFPNSARLILSRALFLLASATGRGANRPGLLQTDFHFQKACIGASFPAGSNANKAIAIRLGNDAFVCFDTDLLRMSAGWTGGFITTKGVSFDGAHGGHPNIRSR